MTDERYKQLMQDVGMPESQSLLMALQQVANETEQRVRAEYKAALRSDVETVVEGVHLPGQWTVRHGTYGYEVVVGGRLVCQMSQINTHPKELARAKANAEFIARTYNAALTQSTQWERLQELWEWWRVHGGELSVEHYSSLGTVLELFTTTDKPLRGLEVTQDEGIHHVPEEEPNFVVLEKDNWPDVFDFINKAKGNMVSYALSPEGKLKLETESGELKADIGDHLVLIDGKFSIVSQDKQSTVDPSA